MRVAVLLVLLLPAAAAEPLTLHAHMEPPHSLRPVEPAAAQLAQPCVRADIWRGTVQDAEATIRAASWTGNATLEWYWAVQGILLDAVTVVSMGDLEAEVAVRSAPQDLVPGAPGHERVGAWDIYRVDVVLSPDQAPFWLLGVNLEADGACSAAVTAAYTDPDHPSALHMENAVGIHAPDLVFEARDNGSLVALYGHAVWGREDILLNVTGQGVVSREAFPNRYCCGYGHDDGHPIAAWHVDHGADNATFRVDARSVLTGQTWSRSIVLQEAEAPSMQAPGASALVLAALVLAARRPTR